MKKLIALLLCLLMVVSVFAGCQDTTPDASSGNTVNNGGNNNGGNKDTTPPTTEGTTPPSNTGYPKELAPAEEIPYTPLYKLTFEDDTNVTAMVQDRHDDENKDGVCDLGDNCSEIAGYRQDGSTYGLLPYEGEILYSNGPVGQCVYLDGTYGLKLDNLVAPADDSYTISFWVNASRLSDYQPTLQIGRNIGRSDVAADDPAVAWINVTQTPGAWLGGSDPSFPSIWNRNSNIGPDTDGDGLSNGVWPWMNDLTQGSMRGKREWVMITIVCTGEAFDHVDATTGAAEPRVGCYFYINGVEVMNGTADGLTPFEASSTYHGLSPEIMKADGLEGYLGINFWDYTMKGFIDELYIYDEVLTAGQVATLWGEGDATVESVEP